MGDNVPYLNSFLPSGIQGFKETLPRMDLCQMGTWFLTHIGCWVCIYIYIYILYITYIHCMSYYIYILHIYIYLSRIHTYSGFLCRYMACNWFVMRSSNSCFIIPQGLISESFAHQSQFRKLEVFFVWSHTGATGFHQWVPSICEDFLLQFFQRPP